jgi:hypothetical protein
MRADAVHRCDSRLVATAHSRRAVIGGTLLLEVELVSAVQW